ncbi:hypothetical protein CANCADRAFT_474 [Tortispora caseinolytica NRRL Y-17796]|uniref:ornithine decarboxylase n=1 Tax=Tortispora caseinolytica NRRL Y-17796 TaxID=767744 RepID=A0A1E4TJF2_9ASCO|nr:hypothetical protein CANCADRAFT_474 [Tortispora caseinolytica NRRL Y-17796]
MSTQVVSVKEISTQRLPMAPSATTAFSPGSSASYLPSTDILSSATTTDHILEGLRSYVSSIDPDECDAGGEDPFFVADIGRIYNLHMIWKKLLSRVEPFYAVKCNNDPVVLRLMAALGTGFDCASKAEITRILDLGVSADRIIYAHPCKASSFVRFAAENNVKNMTVDNVEELYKCKRFFPDANLFLRIHTDDSKSLCRLSIKYGAKIEDAEEILKVAQELGLNMVGVSFHVGSGASDPTAFVEAIENSRHVFDIAMEYGHVMHTLDIGGGFVEETFVNVAHIISRTLDKLFPPHVRVIAEPGRFYVASAFTLATHVIARRYIPQENSHMVYLNDGVYGNMNCIIFDHQVPEPHVLTYQQELVYPEQYTPSTKVKTSLWGPTCDGIDCVSAECYLPYAVEVGDWIYFPNFGAYTLSASSQFNGFNERCHVKYICSEPAAATLAGI